MTGNAGAGERGRVVGRRYGNKGNKGCHGWECCCRCRELEREVSSKVMEDKLPVQG